MYRYSDEDIWKLDGRGIVYDVEMQTSDGGNLPKRSRYYHANIDITMLKPGQDYESLGNSFVIFIEYVSGGTVSREGFVSRLDREVGKARRNAVWRKEYMDQSMRDTRNVNKGIRIGLEFQSAWRKTSFAWFTRKGDKISV